jgi:hypothetical protein
MPSIVEREIARKASIRKSTRTLVRGRFVVHRAICPLSGTAYNQRAHHPGVEPEVPRINLTHLVRFHGPCRGARSERRLLTNSENNFHNP